MNRIVLAGLLALLSVISLAWAQSGEDDLESVLEFWSSGYSRHEIVDGNVVTLWADGVTFELAGIKFDTYELRYDRATKIARATGGVTIRLGSSEVTADELVFDKDRGLLELTGNITGRDQFNGLEFRTRKVQGKLPADTSSLSAEAIDVTVFGPCELTDADGSKLIAGDIDFLAQPGIVKSDSPFSLVLAPASWQAAEGDLPFQLEELLVTGSGFSGSLDDDGHLVQLVMDDLTGTSSQAAFTARKLELTDLELSDTAGLMSNAVVLFSGLSGHYLHEGEQLLYSAEFTKALVDEQGVAFVDLSGGVSIDYYGTPIYADKMRIERIGNDFKMEMADNTAVEFNLAQSAGIEPVSREELGGLIGN
ncbi:hypothetical protein JW859_12800 [bacterium]|nr:hypothetical protein [bacterium]